MEKVIEIIEPIGFVIEGENIVVANPCTIPIKILEDTLKEKREKGLVTACFVIKIPLPKELKKTLNRRKVRKI